MPPTQDGPPLDTESLEPLDPGLADIARSPNAAHDLSINRAREAEKVLDRLDRPES